MANLSEIKAEMSAINDITKITYAMQLVATAKLKKYGKQIVDTQQFVQEVYRVFNEIIQQTTDSPFLADPKKPIKKTLWIVINSNLGLCGGYNVNLNKVVFPQLKPNDEVFAIGQKAINFYKNKDVKIHNQRTDLEGNLEPSVINEVGHEVLDYYTSGEFDEIKLGYTKFVNNVTFTPQVITLFPISKQEEKETTFNREVQFEPSAKVILDTTVNLYINTILYGTLVESQVSEQASRRLAMENATNNGEELVNKLHIQHNRQRQAAITQEINEIVSGANAQTNN
ncbi:F-type H+-transporting ATPase subunit gamma [Entomoplasma freundtii]|uniref:ATP synthase gamma chain n=1 Tax=Entomoplasma freundtii TaxID=74700 RepID=A0A2K8NS81_9MOLU|nr:ATP synthase F1 subunit gamma [Entomoplasma freundtii]ATZ16669.1 F0F1 ATP synthase subunit gamma [Entomoplasma freundtii]TDY58164.1 F-type H+-transporting ATPase subunit gamma [Entomoplasma freundtii]